MQGSIKKLPDESVAEYKDRIYTGKQEGSLRLTWDEITELFESELGVSYSSTKWRRDYKKWLEQDLQEEELSAELREILFELQKERVKVSDERTQNRAYIRRISREETLMEIGKTAAEIVSKKKSLIPFCSLSPDEHRSGIAEAILQLSDWHYGIEVNNPWNNFNTEVCKQRVAELLKETLIFCYTFGVKKLHIVNLGDLIAGRIHITIRLESRCDVVTQTIEVSEMLAEFITALTSDGVEVEYYDCLDNHSRLEPLKSDSLDLESLARIVPWYLKTRCKNNENLHINENEFGEDIITFEVLNGKYLVSGVHGHKDKPNKIVEGLTLMTKQPYDLILAAHLHHFSADEKNESVVVSNGSLMGTDNYAKDLRLSSKASQNLILVTEDSVIDYIHRVPLN